MASHASWIREWHSPRPDVQIEAAALQRHGWIQVLLHDTVEGRKAAPVTFTASLNFKYLATWQKHYVCGHVRRSHLMRDEARRCEAQVGDHLLQFLQGPGLQWPILQRNSRYTGHKDFKLRSTENSWPWNEHELANLSMACGQPSLRQAALGILLLPFLAQGLKRGLTKLVALTASPLFTRQALRRSATS